MADPTERLDLIGDLAHAANLLDERRLPASADAVREAIDILRPAPDSTWVRSERPDRHRSLWCMVARWHVLTAGTGPFLRIDIPPREWTFAMDDTIAEECARLHLPTPTADDLAWLRGTK